MPKTWKYIAITAFLISLVSGSLRAQTNAPSRQPPKKTSLKLLGNTSMILDPACNACEGVSMPLRIRNTGTSRVTLDFSVSGLTNKTSNEAANVATKIEVTGLELPSGSSVTTKSQTPKDHGTQPEGATRITTLGPQEIVTVRVEIKGIVGVGTWQATIKNEDNETGTIEIINPVTPLKIKLVTADTANPQIKLTKGKDASFVLQNDDATGHLVNWTLSADGKLYSPATTTKTGSSADCAPACAKLSPNATQEVFFRPPDDWFPNWLLGVLQPKTKDAKLTLRLASLNCLHDQGAGAPTVTYSLKIQLHTSPESSEAAVSYLIVFVLVLLGGLCSLYVNFAFPDRTRRRTMKAQLADAGYRIGALPSELSSRLRVLAGAESRALEEKIRSLRWYEPNFDEQMTLVQTGIDTLNRRITDISTLGDLRVRFENAQSQNIPPSILSEADQLFERTVDILNKLALTESEFKTVEENLSQIDALLERWKPQIATGRAAQLRQRLQQLDQVLPAAGANAPSLNFDRLQTLFPSLFTQFNGPTRAAIATLTIDENNFGDLDLLAFRLEMIVEFCRAAENRYPQTPDDQRLVKFRTGLQSHLLSTNWAALWLAQNLTKQLSEGSYPEDIQVALSGGRATIRMDRFEARPYQPTRFYVEFDDYSLNSSAARQILEPIWNFGHSPEVGVNDPNSYMEESGWSVTHYFPAPLEYRISVTFRRPDMGVLTQDNQKVTLARTIRVFQGGEGGWRYRLREWRVYKVLVTSWRNFPAIFELLLVLLPVLFGLMAGAKDQLLKMDLLPALIAIWLLGFQSDQIKNLLSSGKKT